MVVEAAGRNMLKGLGLGSREDWQRQEEHRECGGRRKKAWSS